MPNASMSTFARFCAEDNAEKRHKIVTDAKHSSGFDPYTRLRKVMSGSHWLNDDIRVVEDTLKALVNQQTIEWKRTYFQYLADAYLGFWRDNDLRHFGLWGRVIDLEGLLIKVEPELGVRTKGHELIATKLWLPKGGLGDGMRETFLCLLGEVRNKEPWPVGCRLGIWDVSQSLLYHENQMPRRLKSELSTDALEFVGIWNTLRT